MSVNTVSLTGNITRDAELSQTSSSNTSVLNFSIAVTDRRRNSSTGEWEDHPNFIDLTVFGRRAEVIHTWCTKGTKVAVQGKLRQNTWVDKDTGKNRSRITVIVDEIDFMQRRNSDGDSASSYQAPTPAPAANNGGGYADNDDEEIPF